MAGGMDGRLYRPSPGPVSALTVFLHGGMWTVGNLDSHDRLCRRMALATGSAVLAVDYRRAPEHPAPAAVDHQTTRARPGVKPGDPAAFGTGR
jgi:acetyl esterase